MRSSFCNHLSPKTLPLPRTGSGWLDSWTLAVIGLELGSSIVSSSCKPTIVRDLETLNRRPVYLFQFANALLQHHRAGDDQDLAEVQDVIGKAQKASA